MTPAEWVLFLGLAIIIAYQHWRLLKVEDAFLYVMMDLVKDTDGRRDSDRATTNITG